MGDKGRKDDEDPNRRPPQRSPEHKGKGSNSNLRRGLRLIGRAWMPPAPTTTTIGPPPRTPPGPTPIGRTNETLGQESQGTSAQAEAREEPMVFEMEPELESAPSSSSSVPDEEFTPLESDHLWGVPAGAPTPQHVLNRRYDSASSQRSTSSPLPTAYTHQIGQACIIPDLEEGMAQEDQGSQVGPPTPDSLSCPAEGQSSCIAANEDEASGNQVQAEAFAEPNVTGVNGLLGLSGRFQVLYYSDDDAPQPPTHPAVVQHGLLTPAPTPEPTPQPAPPPALEFWLPPDPMQEADFQTPGAGPSNSKKFEEDDGREHE